MRRLLFLAAFVLAACGASSEPTPVTTTESTTTSTTVAPEPSTTTTAAPTTTAITTPKTTVPRTSAPTAAPTTAPAPEPTTEATVAGEPCGKALIGVRAVGLPAGFKFYCSAARTQGHAGLAAWNYNGESFVAVNPGTGDHPGVGAHAACHAQDFVSRGTTSEDSADACAAAHGYPNPYAADEDFVAETAAEKAIHWLVLAVLVAGLVLIGGLLTLIHPIRRWLHRANGHR